uniref:Sulfatase-modifying factor enzyme-like domain-containing protein n=1 Tax=Rhodopseudomonas palustris (strain BisA53) TaxID=316055 RepID=Q07J86_RHOP5
MLIAFKLKIALVAAAGFVGPIALAPLALPTHHPLNDAHEMVVLQAGDVAYRAAGDFTQNGKQAAAPMIQARQPRALAIMKRQVSSADYKLCVEEGGCAAAATAPARDRPAVRISWYDAQAYADWLSRKTGDHYRLPSDQEWAFAAGARFKDDGLPLDAADPSVRWLARYQAESARIAADAEPRPFGHFGANEHGLLDLAGNVWEWTTTCFVRTRLDAAGQAVGAHANCGVRVVEGQHRAYVTDFIRDAKAGGCAAGVPPANLGFRLVREPNSWFSRVRQRIARAAP